MLHDILEDTHVTVEELEKEFGIFERKLEKTAIENLISTSLWKTYLENDCKNQNIFLAVRNNSIGFYHKEGKLFSFETRGSKCTSIDAFVKFNKIGIGIEWKYTETDFDTTKAKDYWKQRYIKRYKPLLENSNIIESDTLISCPMYYELMRQTLLLEQIKSYLNVVLAGKQI